MKIGVISADSTYESRVALTPDAVKKLRKLVIPMTATRQRVPRLSTAAMK